MTTHTKVSPEAACDACAGAGDNANCMCGGSGLATDAVVWLREQLLRRAPRAEVVEIYGVAVLRVGGVNVTQDGCPCTDSAVREAIRHDDYFARFQWSRARLEYAAKKINRG